MAILRLLLLSLLANAIRASFENEFALDKYLDADKFKDAMLQGLKPEYSHLRGQLAGRNYANIFSFLQDVGNIAIRQFHGVTKGKLSL